jgi:mediator of RNA polymerase II transcription subunit 18
MHELLLYGQLPAPRHEQVLKILAGLAAMQPRPVLERHIVYKPTREPDEPGAHLGRGGGSQTIGGKPVKQGTVKSLYYTKLVQKLGEEDFGRAQEPTADNARLSANVKSGEEPKWSFEFQDLPDTGDRGVTARLASSTDILSGDPHAWMIATGPHE